MTAETPDRWIDEDVSVRAALKIRYGRGCRLRQAGRGKSPTQLKRFAKRARTHLFDFSQLGEVPGYAREVTVENELRIEEQIVFDSSAVYEGRSLKDALPTGRTLQNELPLVLPKFGNGSIAFAAEIEAMFSRIGLHLEDARYHRFLWKNPELEWVKVFQMNRVTFGGHLTKWILNCTEAMEAFGGDSSFLTPAQKYYVRENTFDTRVETVSTRLGVLGKMAKICDPLGLLSPAVTGAEIMHWQLGLRGSNWDDDTLLATRNGGSIR
ncbi:hypothetical protein TTRE_0000792201 [Trichuris trichiura]|uniref:Uncharacterized protein n=1 Tax=Trichuris trichiura TaxID=36087 RepID=A0A077ZLR0_TRITR|nr:hypothetical protein TTRE_0000792201 [Trichuris trichiura]